MSSSLGPSLPERLHHADAADRSFVIAHGHVLTMDDGSAGLDADVLVRGHRIVEVRPGLAGQVGPDTDVVDASGCIVMPGLIDSHVHAWEGQLRGTDPTADFNEYMAITHGGIAEHMDPEDVALGERITAAQAINTGVTTIVDNSHNSRTPDHSDALVAALTDAGIRAVHAVGSPVAGSAGTQLPADLLRLRDQYFASDDQLLTLRMFDSEPSFKSLTFARDNGFDLSAEMGMWVPELDKLLTSGVVHPGCTFNHCFGLSGEQWDRIADTGAAVNMVPRSDSHFGLGAFIPVLEAQRRGLQFGISCDNEICYGYDMFTEMRVLMTVQRGLSFQAQYAGDTGAPGRMTPNDALAAATIGGALNARLSSSVGTLTPGKRADIVVLDLDHVHTQPFGSWVGTVVSWANVSNVRDVFVDGRARKWRGRLVDVDYPALVDAGHASRERLWGAVGASVDDIRDGRGTLRRDRVSP